MLQARAGRHHARVASLGGPEGRGAPNIRHAIVPSQNSRYQPNPAPQRHLQDRRAGMIIIAGPPASTPTAGISQRGTMSTVPSEVVKDLAPTGKLRAAINLGNPVLAQGTPQEPRGVTVDLARELARRAGLPIELVPFDGAGKVFEALKVGAWDIAFLAIEPVRAAEIAFTAPYVIIEGVYMVPKDSALKTVADVDKAGVRVGVNKNSAYDLFLTRTLKNAELMRADNGVKLFVEQKLDAAGGVKQPLVAYAKTNPN